MATITKDRIWQRGNLDAGGVGPRTQPEGASQTFVVGEIVMMSGGYATEIAGDTPTAIYGVAGMDAHNDTVAATHEVSIYMATENVVFGANVLTTSAADYVLLASDIGRVMGIQRVTADSKVYLNAGVVGGANARVFVHGLERGSALGDTNARVLFTFLPANIQFRATS